jgi:endonuclease I
MNIIYLSFYFILFKSIIIDTLLIKNKYKNEMHKKYSIHKKLNYKNAKKILHNELNDIIIYGNKTYSDKKNNMNCEHIWCRTYFDNKEPMNSDLHIIYLSNSRLNSHRQSYKFDEINIELNKNYTELNKNYTLLDEYGNKIYDITCLDSKKICKKNNKNKVFEPPDISKGKIARSCAYFMLVYPEYLHYLPKLIDIDVLLKWNRNYMVDYKEIYKNEMIYMYQYNINPFIKYPILVELFFSNKLDIFNVCKLLIITFFTIIMSLIINLYIKSIFFIKLKK